MALFKKKKKIPSYQKKPLKRSIPSFPEYEATPKGMPDYEPSEDYPIPKYKPPEDLKPLPIPDFEIPKRMPSKIELVHPEREEFNPRMIREMEPEILPREENSGEPIFVKLEDYKKSIENLRTVKEMLNEAEKILSDIQSLKTEEDRRISSWQQEISDIKSKLMEIDKALFEYP